MAMCGLSQNRGRMYGLCSFDLKVGVVVAARVQERGGRWFGGIADVELDSGVDMVTGSGLEGDWEGWREGALVDNQGGFFIWVGRRSCANVGEDGAGEGKRVRIWA